MAGSALIDTSNRLLGWSTSDFSLYGGQAAVTIGAPAKPFQGSDGLSVPDPAISSGSQRAQPEAAALPEEAGDDVAETHDPVPSAYHFTPFIPAPIQFSDAAHAQALEAQVPTAVGSGSPAIEAFQAPAFLPPASSTGLAAPTLAIAQSEADAAPALAIVGGLAAPVLGLSQAIDHTLWSVDHILTPAAEGALPTADQTIASLEDTVSVVGQALPTVDDTLSAVDHTLSTVAASADMLLDGKQQAVDALQPLSDIVAADGFLGSDPIGGVATLVSMVDSADAFDLSHAGLDVPDVAASGSILDMLADEAVAGPLLGDVEHDVDTILPDHHDHGVLGL